MDFDFLNRSFLDASRSAIANFRDAVEQSQPTDKALEDLCQGIRPYKHTSRLDADFSVGAVDGSGEFPIVQQDDVFVHFAVAAGSLFRTESNKQHKLAVADLPNSLFSSFAVLKDSPEELSGAYQHFLDELLGLSIEELVRDSDYCRVFSNVGKKIGPGDVRWNRFVMPKAAQISSHAYQLRSLAELGMAIRLIESRPKYALLDTSLVYFLLGESLFLPELLKRYLTCRAETQGTAVIAINKSHNIPNGDLIGRWANERLGYKDHWFLRLPSKELGETPLEFLKDKEVPPKLGVSYLFKFHETSFPMRIDVDAEWWKKSIDYDIAAEYRLFEDLDYTCHDIRSYGYPYPMHAAHRRASLNKQERNAIRDVLMQHAQTEGVLRGAFLRDPEAVHMEGI